MNIIAFIEVSSFILCLVLGAFWIKDPSGPYEPPFAVSGLVLVGTELYRRYRKKTSISNPNIKDIELFEEFIALFSDNDLIRFYKEHVFLASFERKYIEPLYCFVETWDNAAHQFIDEELERNRMILYEAGKNLGMKIAEKTVPNKNGFISVKPDSLPYGPTPDWVVNDAKEINSLVPTFVECHEKFIKLGRKKLYSK